MHILRAGHIIFVSRIINMFLMLILNIILARVFIKEDFAIYVVVSNLAIFLGLLVSFGCQNIALKQFSDAREGIVKVAYKDLLKPYIRLIIATSITVFIIYSLLSLFGLYEKLNIEKKADFYLLVYFWGVAIGFQVVIVEMLRGLKHFVSVSLANSLASNAIAIIGLLILIYFNEVGLDYFLIIMISAILFVQILSVNSIRNTIHNQSHMENNETTYSIAKHALPSFTNKIGLHFTSLSDVWLLAAFSSAAFVADYGAAAKIATIVSFFATLANAITPPYITTLLKNNDNYGLERFSRTISSYITIPALFIIVLIFLYSESILTLVYGESYINGSSVLSILVFAHLSNVLTGNSGYILVMQGKNKTLMHISIFSGIVSIGIAYTFLHLKYDPIYVAYAYAAGIILRQVLACIAVYKLNGILTLPYLNLGKCLKLNELKEI